MDEYINRKALLAEIAVDHGDWLSCNDTDELYRQGVEDNYSDTIRLINEMPAADIQPMKHGRWEETHISLCKWIPEDEKEEGHSFYMAEMKCSCCKRYNTVAFVLTLDKPDFCQLCGARMMKDDDK